MNAKRQTIWLVSMLSLMVVLSAYYLFTEDTGKLDLTAASGSVNSKAGNEVNVDLKDPAIAKVDGKDASKVEVKPDPAASTQTTAAPTDGKAADAKASDSKATTDAKATDSKATDAKATDSTATDASGADKATSGQASGGKTTAEAGAQVTTDQQVLDKMATSALSGSDYFADAQLKRDDEISKKTEQLMTIITNSKEKNDALEKAYNDLDQLQNMNSKMIDLEGKLTKDFPNAVVTKDGEKYKVTVQANKLERSQAVTIVDLTMSEMNVGQDKVIVQYLP